MFEEEESYEPLYTTAAVVGTKVDCCDHEHATHDEAQRCLVEHQNAMRREGKVSRRIVFEIKSLDSFYEECY